MGKYTSKKNGMSHYPERLQARGVSPVQVRMPFYDEDGKKHGSMEEANRANGNKHSGARRR